MHEPTDRAAEESQPSTLRASPDAAAHAPVLVEGRRYWCDWGGAVVVPGVAGTDDTEEIPERRVRFLGAPICVEINLQQRNSFIGLPRDPREAAETAFVACVTGWSIALNGVVVYGGMRASTDAPAALVEAAAALPRVLALPVRLWENPPWDPHRLLLDGVPSLLVGLQGNVGKVVVEAADDGAYGHEADGTPITEALVDPLSDRIVWTWWRSAEDGDAPADDA